jgi:hypothetical protein
MAPPASTAIIPRTTNPDIERVKDGKALHESQQLQHRVTRTRVKASKLLEFEPLLWPLWIRRVLVHPKRWPSARAQEGQWLPRQREPFFVVVSSRLRRLRIELRGAMAGVTAPAVFLWDLPSHSSQEGHCSRDRGSRRTGPEAGALTSKIGGSPRQTRTAQASALAALG